MRVTVLQLLVKRKSFHSLAMLASAIPIFIASLIGSPHCAGMCGGFVAVYSRMGNSHLGYSAGRLVTYLTLGAIAGYAGGEVNTLSGVGHLAAIGVGIILILEGLRGFFGKKVLYGEASSPLAKPLQMLLEHIERVPRAIRGFLVGLTSTLIPCGWLYSFVALAAASGSAIAGVATLATFWLGTLPVMLSVATVMARVIPKLGSYAPRVTSALVVLAGLMSVSSHYIKSVTTSGCGCH